MRWAVSALENDSLAWKIGPPSFSVVVGSDKAGAGEEWKIWEIIQFLPRYLSSHFSSIMLTQNLQESIFWYLLVDEAEESILSISWHSAGWSLLCVGCFIRTPSVSITHNTLLRYLDRPTLKHSQQSKQNQSTHLWSSEHCFGVDPVNDAWFATSVWLGPNY